MTPALSTEGDSPGTGRRTTGHDSAVRALLTRRWPAALGIVFSLLVFGDGVESVDGFAIVLVFMPVAYLLFGWARGELAHARALAVQVGALVAYSLFATAAVVLGGDAGRYVLAVGWLGHAAWDLRHYHTGRVVPRAWAEWCFVVDVLGAAAFLIL